MAVIFDIGYQQTLFTIELKKVTYNIFEIGTLKNLHFDTNVAVLTEAFVNVWTKLVLAAFFLIKWRIRRSTKVKYKLFLYTAIGCPHTYILIIKLPL